MSGSSKKIAGILILLLLVLGGVGYFAVLPMLEKQVAEKVAAAIDALPGDLKADDIQVSLLGKKVTISSLRGNTTYIDGSDMYIDIARVVCSGPNVDAGKTPGVTPIAGELYFTDLKVQMKTDVEGLEQALQQDSQIREMRLTGLRGDVAAISLAASGMARDQKTQLGQMVDAMLSIHMDSLEGKGYINRTSSAFGPMVASLDSFSYKDFSPLKSGPMEAKNFKLNAFNSDLLTIDLITSKAGQVPNIFNAMFTSEIDPEAGLREMIDVFSRDTLALDGITVEKLSFKLMTEEPLTLAKGTINLRMNADKIVFQHSLDGLVIPAELYRKASPEADQFARQYDNALDINASMDIEVHQKNGSGDIFVKNLQVTDKNLGSASVSAELLFKGRGDSLEDLMNEGADLFLKSSRTELEDLGFMQVFYAVQFASMERFNMLGDSLKTPADLRALKSRSALEEAAAAEDADQKRVLEGLAKLLAAPGKLVVSLNPTQPVDMDTLAEGGNSKTQLNSSVEFTPAQ